MRSNWLYFAVRNAITREEIREYLNPVYDLERLISKISYKTAGPRDLNAFAGSLYMLPHIKFLLKNLQAPLLQEIYEEIDELSDLYELVKTSIQEEPPITIRGSYYLVFYHPAFDFLQDCEKVLNRVENLAWNFDPSTMGFAWNETECQDYQRMIPETIGYEVLRPVRKS